VSSAADLSAGPHRREDKPAWWRYFYLRTLSPAELTGEPDALGALTGGDVVGQVKRSVVRRIRFPPQEHKFSTGGTACDPDTDKQRLSGHLLAARCRPVLLCGGRPAGGPT
jgi:hypothetical protein